jgi:molybdopterin converting factor subunit 1
VSRRAGYTEGRPLGEGPVVNVRVKLFAVQQETIGQREVLLDLPEDACAGDVPRALGERYPVLTPFLSSVALAVNLEFVGPSHPLQEGDEVAIIPPVSGGASPWSS